MPIVLVKTQKSIRIAMEVIKEQPKNHCCSKYLKTQKHFYVPVEIPETNPIATARINLEKL